MITQSDGTIDALLDLPTLPYLDVVVAEDEDLGRAIDREDADEPGDDEREEKSGSRVPANETPPANE